MQLFQKALRRSLVYVLCRHTRVFPKSFQTRLSSSACRISPSEVSQLLQERLVNWSAKVR
jgi:predicted DNA-binding transcriptional regulator AlpA